MKPVHELTTDEAVAELEKVCDELDMGVPWMPNSQRNPLLARKTELEAWILMHQPKEAAMATGEGKPPHHGALKSPQPEPAQEAPMPKPKQTEEEKRAKNREYNRKWAQKKAAEKKAAKADVPAKAPKTTTSAKRVEETPVVVHIGLYTPNEAVLLGITSRLVHLQGQVLGVTAEVITLPIEDRAHLLEAAANLDALAHQLAQFLATGRIEVAA